MTIADVDVAQIRRWAETDTEQGSELSSFQRFAGMGFDPDTGDLVDYSGEWRARDIIEMLDLDGIARAGEQALTLPLRGAPLAVKGQAGDKGEAELVNQVFAQLADPIEDTVGHGAQSLIYRMSFLEKLWTVRDSRTVYSALAYRPVDSCAPTRDPVTGALTGFKQQMTWWGGRSNPKGHKPGTWVPIRADKACIFVHGRTRDPVYGVSELTVARRIFEDKQKIKFLWSVFLKGAAISRVIAKTQSGQEAKVASTLAKLASGGVAAVSDVDEITVLNATDSGTFFKEALAYLDAEMLASILAGFLGLTGAATSGRGSYALSKDQSDFFTQAQDASAREISSTIRSQLVRPLCVVNFGPAAVIPKVTLGPVARATAQEQMQFLKELAGGPGQAPIVPRELIDELVLQIAGYLDLDVDKVAAAIKAAEVAAIENPPDGTAPETAATSAAIGAGTGIVARGLTGVPPLPAAS